MYAQVEKPKENKSKVVADSVTQKKGNVKQGFGFVDNRPESIAQRKIQESVCNSQNIETIQMMKFGKAPRFQNTFASRTGLQGIVLGNNPDSTVRNRRHQEQELPSESQFIHVGEQELPSESQFIHVGEQELPSESQFIHVGEPELPSESQFINIGEPETHPVAKIGLSIRQTGSMDCDRWARDFQERLEQGGNAFTPIKLMIRRNKNKSTIASAAKITFDGEAIGHDTHFFTIVQIDGKNIVFDNLNPGGMEENEHRRKLRFFLEDPNNTDRYDPLLEEVSFDGNVIVSNESR